MAIFGFGASQQRDVVQDFFHNNAATVGWDISEAPGLYEIMRTIKIGDIVYIKSTPIGSGLRVKGVGIVTDNTLIPVTDIGTGVTVRWLWRGHNNLGTIADRMNVRNNTLYEEHTRQVQDEILNLLFSSI